MEPLFVPKTHDAPAKCSYLVSVHIAGNIPSIRQPSFRHDAIQVVDAREIIKCEFLRTSSPFLR
jgi:hypothetical protein